MSLFLQSQLQAKLASAVLVDTVANFMNGGIRWRELFLGAQGWWDLIACLPVTTAAIKPDLMPLMFAGLLQLKAILQDSWLVSTAPDSARCPQACSAAVLCFFSL